MNLATIRPRLRVSSVSFIESSGSRTNSEKRAYFYSNSNNCRFYSLLYYCGLNFHLVLNANGRWIFEGKTVEITSLQLVNICRRCCDYLQYLNVILNVDEPIVQLDILMLTFNIIFFVHISQRFYSQRFFLRELVFGLSLSHHLSVFVSRPIDTHIFDSPQ
jgi:hypothetical protein